VLDDSRDGVPDGSVTPFRDGGARSMVDSAPPMDARPFLDANHSRDAGGESASCIPPLNEPDAGVHSTCVDAMCPPGTACAEEYGGGTRSVARCVAVPAECGGEPTCACMSTEAAACLFGSVMPELFFCQDATEGDTGFIAFVCKCN
jgi:hypothetical protein